MWKLILATCAVLMAACIVSADEFDEQLAKYAAKTVSIKAKPVKTTCTCCGDIAACDCTTCLCPACAAKAKVLPAAPSATFKHDCGCPSASCNCGAGGCHCSENRIDNRQPARWVRDGDHWYLYRGQQCLGAMKVNGSQFFIWNGTDYLPTPMKPPSVPPYNAGVIREVDPMVQRQQYVQAAMRAAPVCRS